jgi:hypothetical protein
VGYVAIVGVTLVGHVLALGFDWISPMVWPVRAAGLAIEYVAWTIGLGAALASLSTSPRVIPPRFDAIRLRHLRGLERCPLGHH